MARENLVIIRAGKNSLHNKWENNEFGKRSFDIATIYYEIVEGIKAQDVAEFSELHPGAKIGGILSWCADNKSLITKYNRIALIDDDIMTSHKDLDRLFSYSDIIGAEIAQPALSHQSYYTSPITRQHRSFLHRWTNWVEIMCPVFRSSTLLSCLDSFEEMAHGGSYIEYLWASNVAQIPGSFAIIDMIPVHHTREVQTAGSGVSGAPRMQQFYDGKLLYMQKGAREQVDNICGLTNDGRFLDISSLEFAESLIRDINTTGIDNHAQYNSKGGLVLTELLVEGYAENCLMNYESFSMSAHKPEKLTQAILALSVLSGLLYTSLKCI